MNCAIACKREGRLSASIETGAGRPGASAVQFVVTCEHGGNRIPPRYQSLFAGYRTLLHSHRGYDRGALRMAKELAVALNAALFAATISRLLIDLNRSTGHPHLFSDVTKVLPAPVRCEILAHYYSPYRHRVEKLIADEIDSGKQVIHISSHSFTPIFDGQLRHADIGLLYDPARVRERLFCCDWQASLKAKAPGLIIRRNYPYTGRADGITVHLRRRFPASRYLGIELEINQKHVVDGGQHWRAVRHFVLAALIEVVAASIT